MHLDEPIPPGHKIVIHKKYFWLADESGNLVDRVLWPRNKNGDRIYFHALDGSPADVYNNRHVVK